jgi:hypothetical protein
MKMKQAQEGMSGCDSRVGAQPFLFLEILIHPDYYDIGLTAAIITKKIHLNNRTMTNCYIKTNSQDFLF